MVVDLKNSSISSLENVVLFMMLFASLALLYCDIDHSIAKVSS